ncbi:hypothetical protein [Sanyastnella coralliicola]|uniref:hypothetical protein n=1 Tax=Sanyastnella coralliicola TaxID=3069118 RepID=UPI0027B88638|nr:hypothetical protein [Longitalea sp. SCSIO 12813]
MFLVNSCSAQKDSLLLESKVIYFEFGKTLLDSLEVDFPNSIKSEFWFKSRHCHSRKSKDVLTNCQVDDGLIFGFMNSGDCDTRKSRIRAQSQILTSVSIKSSELSTSKGLKIGMSKKEIDEIFGFEGSLDQSKEQFGVVYIYDSGCSLYFKEIEGELLVTEILLGL